MKPTRTDISKTNNVSPFLLLESRQEQLLSLRKKKLNNMLLLKRKGKFNEESKFVPYINEKEISQSVIAPPSLTPIEQLSFYIRLLSPNRNNLNNFFYLINKINLTLSFFENELELLKAIQECKVVEYLFLLLKDNTNKIAIYQIYLIFLKISLIGDTEFIDKKFIGNYHCEMYLNNIYYLKEDVKDNEEILSTIIIFLGNLISLNIYFQHCFYTQGIYQCIIELIEGNLLLKECIAFLTLFSAVKEFPDDIADKIYDIFSFVLSNIVNANTINENIEMVKDIIWGLSFVSFETDNQELPSKYIKDNTVNILLKISESIPELSMIIQKPLIHIIGNLASFECIDCSVFYNEQTAKFIVNSLLYSTPQTQIETLWLISNLALGTDMKCLHQYSLLSTMTLCVINNTVSFSLSLEIMKTLCSLIYSSNEPQSILTVDVVNALISFSGSDVNDEVKTVCIVMIDAVMKYGTEEMKRLIRLSNIKENIDKWSITTEQKEIREEAVKLIEEMNEYE